MEVKIENLINVWYDQIPTLSSTLSMLLYWQGMKRNSER